MPLSPKALLYASLFFIQLPYCRSPNLYNIAMSENFIKVAPGCKRLFAENGCILWNETTKDVP